MFSSLNQYVKSKIIPILVVQLIIANKNKRAITINDLVLSWKTGDTKVSSRHKYEKIKERYTITTK